MGAKNSGAGIELRKGSGTETIRITFLLDGKRCRESLSLPHTKTNNAYAKRLQREIVNAIARNEFNYEEYFPASRTVKELKRAQFAEAAARPPVIGTTYIDDLLHASLHIAEHNLALSTYNCYCDNAEAHLFRNGGHCRRRNLPAVCCANGSCRSRSAEKPFS